MVIAATMHKDIWGKCKVVMLVGDDHDSCDVMEHLDFLFLSSSGYILLKVVKIDGVLKSKRALLYFYFLLYVFTQCTYIVIRCETYFL